MQDAPILCIQRNPPPTGGTFPHFFYARGEQLRVLSWNRVGAHLEHVDKGKRDLLDGTWQEKNDAAKQRIVHAIWNRAHLPAAPSATAAEARAAYRHPTPITARHTHTRRLVVRP
jgi:hypothetical protein